MVCKLQILEVQPGSRPPGLNSVDPAVSPCPSQPLLSLESSLRDSLGKTNPDLVDNLYNEVDNINKVDAER